MSFTGSTHANQRQPARRQLPLKRRLPLPTPLQKLFQLGVSERGNAQSLSVAFWNGPGLDWRCKFPRYGREQLGDGLHFRLA